MRTALYDRHVASGAKIVPFAGWDMPLSYRGILLEHQAVRQRAGLFDVSHMGRIDIEGKEAESFVNFLSTNELIHKTDGTVTYTVLCDEQGGSVDDVLIYRFHSQHFSLVANASNREKDWNHLKKYASQFDVHLSHHFDDRGLLALQGPLAGQILASLVPQSQSLKPMRLMVMQDENQEILISRTGYTGADGFELSIPNRLLGKWWDRLLEKGKPLGLEPVGLGARDVLRLEMGFALYGHELSDTIAPTESVAAWTVKWQKPSFLGRAALDALEKSPAKRLMYGITIREGGIAREGYPVFLDDACIGHVTSGSFSPTLNQAIAIILVNQPLVIEQEVRVDIRRQLWRARVAKLPFIRSL